MKKLCFSNIVGNQWKETILKLALSKTFIYSPQYLYCSCTVQPGVVKLHQLESTRAANSYRQYLEKLPVLIKLDLITPQQLT